MAPPRRIVIADDHPLMRAAVAAAVAAVWPDLPIVEVGDAAAARAEVAAGGVEVVTLDLQMADSNGLEPLLGLRRDFPEVPVVVVSASDSTATTAGARQLGASGFIAKTASLAEMRAALAMIRDGDQVFPDSAAVSGEPARDDAIARLAALTPAQRRILALVGEGQLNKQIAHQLAISEATVKAHLTAIFRRLGVFNRTQAVLIARYLQN